METAFVIGLLLVSGVFAGRHVLRTLGFGMPKGKPDCGCGGCTEKKRK
jgi:hypothetical protein